MLRVLRAENSRLETGEGPGVEESPPVFSPGFLRGELTACGLSHSLRAGSVDLRDDLSRTGSQEVI